MPLHVLEKYADAYTPEKYREPVTSMIVAPIEGNYTNSYDLFLAQLPVPQHTDLPGTPTERAVFALLHEGMHGVGAGEKAAEKGAAAIHKRAFNNNAYLKREADIRAVRNFMDSGYMTLTDRGTREDARIYTWSMCEALDDIVRTPQAQLLEMDEAQIKNLRFDGTDPNWVHASNISFVLQYRASEYFALKSAAEKEMTKGSLQHEGDRRVCERFLVAWKRLHIGGAAYTNTNDPYDITPGVDMKAPRLPWFNSPVIARVFGFEADKI